MVNCCAEQLICGSAACIRNFPISRTGEDAPIVTA